MGKISIKTELMRLPEELLKQLSSDAIPVAERETLSRIVDDTDKYVPYRTGELAESVTVNPKDNSFTYAAPYASFAFDGTAPSGRPKVYYTGIHPLAQANPDDAAYDREREDWEAYFADRLVGNIEWDGVVR